MFLDSVALEKVATASVNDIVATPLGDVTVVDEEVIDYDSYHLIFAKVYKTPSGRFVRFTYLLSLPYYDLDPNGESQMEVSPQRVTVTRYTTRKG